MLWDVVDTLETEANDGTNGLNARISTLNSEEGLSGAAAVPSLNTIQVWGPTDGTEAELPGEMAESDLPALVVRIAGTESELQNQAQRAATHQVECFWLDHEPDQARARKFIGHMQKVLVRWLEGVIGQGTIANIDRFRYDARRWLLAGQGTSIERSVMACRIIERDPNP